VQDLQAYFWEAGAVDRRLEQVMTRAYERVRELAAKRSITMRDAAYRIAVTKVARATHVRGIYP
jgi:glutamate dehydrogenase (NAD(P)+)